MYINPYKNTIYQDFIPVPKEPHNTNMKNSAIKNAAYNRKHPSWLEKKMIEFLDSHKIKYTFQAILYIKSKGGFIKQYYIADFYIPRKKIIIETDGKFHEEQKEYDDFRTKDIQKNFPGTTVIRWSTKDFNSYANMKKLLELIK